MKLRYPTIFITLLILIAIPNNTLHAQSSVEIVSQQVSYLFGNHIAFEAEVDTDSSIRAVEIYFRQAGSTQTSFVTAELDENNLILGVYEISQGVQISAFTKVTYWFRVLMDFQGPYESPHYEFEYKDNRFEWDEFSAPPFSVYTFQGNNFFAAEIAAAAHIAIANSTSILGEYNMTPIDIYVYRQSEDLKYALNLTESSWIAGHANPALGVVLVSIQSSDPKNPEIGRQVPHEVTHLLLYQAYPIIFEQLPLWLNEGLSSVAETNTLSAYQQTVEQSAASGGLLPFSEICSRFPSSVERASLAYAQSASFVAYLIANFESEKIEQLYTAYADVQNCDIAPFEILGASLPELEQAWKQSLGSEQSQSGFSSGIFACIIIMLLVLIAIAAIFIFKRFNQNVVEQPPNHHGD